METRKRKADDDPSDRPSARPRPDSIFVNNDDDTSGDQSAIIEELLEVSSSTVVGQTTLLNPDPDVERKLQEAFHAVIVDKKNIFISGPAGSGKSYMTKRIERYLDDRKIKVHLIAPTGTAAMNIGGRTCHSFFRVTPNLTNRGIMEVAKAAKRPETERRLLKTKVLIIDEVSMISNALFEQMSRMAQEALRNDSKPFGGIQIIAIGDFAQLGPINALEHCVECGEARKTVIKDKVYSCTSHGRIDESSKWAFKSDHWRRLKFKHIILDKILRQKDEVFGKIVFDMWLGNTLSANQLATLKQDRPVPEPYVRLFSTRKAVDLYNERELAKLRTPTVRYICQDKFELNDDHKAVRWIKRLGTTVRPNHTLLCYKNHRFPEDLVLRVGMPVLLLQNLNVKNGLVNGSQGEVIGFKRYSPTVYRSSGGGLDSTGYSWDDDSGFVMSDYVESLGGDYGEAKHEGIRAWYSYNAADTIPIVRFSNGLEHAIEPETDIEEVVYGKGISRKIRTQIPLMAGWASTIHRAQGMTLRRVVADFSKTFDPAQYYVAISRASSLNGLKVVNLKGKSLDGHAPEVMQFMREILPEHIKAQMRD